DLGHLPRMVVADTETLKVAFFMQLVDFAQRDFKRSGSVRPMQVPQVKLIGLQRFQASHKTCAEILWRVRIMFRCQFWAKSRRVELRIHYQSPSLPVEISKVLFR